MKHALALAVALLPSLLQSKAPPALQFHWPAGITARVETDYFREHSTGQAVDAEARLHVVHRMRILPHAEGLRIQYDKQTFVDSSGNLEQSLIALLPLWIPATIISGDGQFVRIEDAEQIQRNVADMFEPKLRSDAAQAWPAFKDYAERMTSEDALRVLAAADWDQLVGRWVAFPITEQVIESSGALGLSSDVRVPTRVSRAMLGRAPCSRGEVVLECGVYEMTTRIDRDGLAVLLKALTQGVGGPPPGLEWLDIEKSERVSLESATMLPHEYTITRTLHQAADDQGQAATADIERIQSVFTYITEQ